MPRKPFYTEEKQEELVTDFLKSQEQDLRAFLMQTLNKPIKYFDKNPGWNLRKSLEKKLEKVGAVKRSQAVVVNAVEIPPQPSSKQSKSQSQSQELNKNLEQAQKAKNSLFSILAFKINEEIQNIKNKKKSLMSVKELVELIKLSKIELREPVSLSMTVNQEIKKEDLVKSLKQFSWLDVD